MASKLTPALARKLADAEARYSQAAATTAQAKQDRDELRDRVRPRLEPGELLTVGGVLVTYAESQIASYVVKAHTRENWTVDRVPK